MAWSGGTYTRTNGVFTGALVWTDDFNAGTKIVNDHHDTHDQDLAQGINACINKNGQNAPTANIDWGGFKITGLAQGTDGTDSARTAQTITAATIGTATKILTLTRADGDVTVDLTPIVVAGDTSNFAQLSVTQTFTGVNTFTQLITAAGRITMGYDYSAPDWRLDTSNQYLFTLASNSGAGAAFNFFADAGSVGGCYMTIGGYKVWHTGTLDPTNYVKTTDNAYITGDWSFLGSLILLPSTVSIPIIGGGATWNMVGQDSSLMTLTPSGGNDFSFIYSPTVYTAGSAILVNNYEVWNKANLKVSGATPSGGNTGDVWVVTSGASKGLWAKIAGTWTQIL